MAAQSLTFGTVGGTVRSVALAPVPQARVAMVPIGSVGTYETTTSATGSFSFGLVQPGSYLVRVEALGYRPLVARVLTIGGGEERALSLTIRPERPPVTQIDTVALPAASSSRWRAGGVQFGGREIDGLPQRFDDLASVVGLSTEFDEALGAQGLPGDMTLIYADGVPFYRAPHPSARRELLPDALFPRSALAAVRPVHNATDVEMAGSAGGYLALTTRTSAGSDGTEVDGAYAGDPTWSSGSLEAETPSLLSWQAGARSSVVVSPRTRLLLSAEALTQETPFAPRISESATPDFAALDPGLVSSLLDPGVEQYERYSGLVRLDHQVGSSTHLFLRTAGSYSRRGFDVAGPVSLSGLAVPAEESSDFAAAFGFMSQSSRTMSFELRSGFSGSYRDFDASIDGVPPAFLSAAGQSLGDVPSATGSSNRTDFVLIPVVRWGSGGTGSTKFKVGTSLRVSSHAMSHTAGSPGEYAFSGPDEVAAGSGFGALTSAPEGALGSREFGVFTQYESSVGPALRLRLGGRYDYELIGGDGVPLNADWLDATGIRNSDFDDGHHQFGVRGSITWDAVPGRTRVIAAGSLHEGDVDMRALTAAHSQATEATSTRYAGTGIDWPDGGIPALAAPARPLLTLLGPDLRAPRTSLVELGLVQRISSLGSVFIRGSSRRTDFLTRRRNLNLPLVPTAVDPNGRSVFGTVVQDGALVTTTADDARRFPAFGEVWALDPDGWSEYVGLSVGVERSSARLDLYASYTFSRTRDNWIGAGSGTIGAALPPGLPGGEGNDEWAEGTSDFDVPHRAVLGAGTRLGRFTVTGLYRFRSGSPFTPRYRLGVDANGDGSMRNDVAFVPSDGSLDPLLADWDCLSDQVGGFAVRNSCRRPAVHSLSARLGVNVAAFGAWSVRLTLDAFNLLDSGEGTMDDALLLVDPTGSIVVSPDGSTLTLPTGVNPDFGTELYPDTRGRLLRIGLRIGG